MLFGGFILLSLYYLLIFFCYKSVVHHIENYLIKKLTAEIKTKFLSFISLELLLNKKIINSKKCF
ncbi:hypothetical protein KUTeg_014548 [Tegillarca granosa]|uniref:ATP synthase F0 subunit 8 n=1 Tax=Tegillarca granosa TaxID=220873 RepID=A0ABQ9EVC2_TEGGR|nr:hypothetical protein KUTeg_014548 [Tegillarca granosa]